MRCGVQALAQRLLRDERVDLGHAPPLAAGREVRLDRELERREPQLLEPADLGGRERLVGDVVERRPAPQSERLARPPCQEPLEPAGVDVLRRDLQLIAMATRDDRLAVAVPVSALRSCDT